MPEIEVTVTMVLSGPDDALDMVRRQLVDGRARIDLPRDHNGHDYVRFTLFYDDRSRSLFHLEVPVLSQVFVHDEVADVAQKVGVRRGDLWIVPLVHMLSDDGLAAHLRDRHGYVGSSTSRADLEAAHLHENKTVYDHVHTSGR